MSIRKKIKREATSRLKKKFDKDIERRCYNSGGTAGLYHNYLQEEYKKYIQTNKLKRVSFAHLLKIMEKAFIRTHIDNEVEKVEDEFYEKVMKDE